jgi:hypothetical protein
MDTLGSGQGQVLAFVNTVMNLHVPQRRGIIWLD